MTFYLTISEVKLIREALWNLVDITRDQGDTAGEAEALALYRQFAADE
jgi:hypothetical protein